jgi:GMP synthase (glutamine-hydrolysing)
LLQNGKFRPLENNPTGSYSQIRYRERVSAENTSNIANRKTGNSQIGIRWGPIAVLYWVNPMNSTSPAKTSHLLVIDPAVKTPELDCFNRIALRSSWPATYHLPALGSMQSLREPLGEIVGIILLGSNSSVNEELFWKKELEAWLRPKMEQGIPTLGLCYGHQLIAQMFGAKIDFVFPDRRKYAGWRKITLNSDPLWGESTEGSVTVSHAEAVMSCPQAFRVSAKSSEIPIEGLAHEKLPIWTFQAHPEATTAFWENRGWGKPQDPRGLRFGWGLMEKFIDYIESKKM